MRFRFRVSNKQIIVMLLSLVITSGCIETNTSQPASQPIETQYQGDLTAVDSSVTVFRGENPATEVKRGETENIQVDDRIEVDQDGRGILNLSNLLKVELFRNTKVRIADLHLESGGSIFVSLNQIQGHTGVSLSDQSLVRLTLETDYATIKTLEDGTEFIVCHAPGNLTCLDVEKGAVEVTGQGKKQTIKAGEATYILKDQPPKPAICAPVEIFIAWEDQMRKSADTPAVGDVVAELPQQPCSAPTSETAVLPGSEGMVKIPYGTYEVGSSPANETHSALQNIPLDNFWIDIYEVTNAQYQKYLDVTGEQPPEIWPGQENHPVRGVTWDQAVAYCNWVKKRLPSEAEWEVAGRGRGPDAPLYPWGNDPEDGGKIDNLPLDETYDVGSFSFDKSYFGLYDMAGNVYEWVGEPYDSVQAGYKILRGGRFGYIKDLAFREPVQPNDEHFVPYAGFRCAADQVEGK